MVERAFDQAGILYAQWDREPSSPLRCKSPRYRKVTDPDVSLHDFSEFADDQIMRLLTTAHLRSGPLAMEKHRSSRARRTSVYASTAAVERVTRRATT
jgi:hypothetical protein